MTESEQRRLEELRQKMAQMKAQERAIIARDNERKRKERTRRLIQMGTIVEKCLDCADITDMDEFENLLKIKLGAVDG